MSQRKIFSETTKKCLYANYNGKCAICGKHIKYKRMTIDHIVPLSQGGTDDFENLQLALTFNGRPADTLPFTFDAQKGGFVRVDYKGANFQGINLTLNWIIPLNKILELKAQTQKLMKGVKL